jgi:hypothetical protein
MIIRRDLVSGSGRGSGMVDGATVEISRVYNANCVKQTAFCIEAQWDPFRWFFVCAYLAQQSERFLLLNFESNFFVSLQSDTKNNFTSFR